MNYLVVGLFLLFTLLKLTDYIDWSWWWVTSPLWMGVTLLTVLYVGAIALLSK